MKRLHNIFFYIMALLAVGFTGCTDELDYPGGDTSYDGLVLRIPDPQGLASTRTSTRAGDEVDIAAGEGKINDLWLYVFKSEDNSFVTRVDLKEINNAGSLNQHDGYKTYDLTDVKEIKGGNSYRFYVVGNLASYCTLTASPADEDSFKNTVLNFLNGTDESTKYLLSHANVAEHGLPMACIPSEIQYAENGGTPSVNPDGNVSIGKKQGLIHADLAFLCAKVRYTVLFDNTRTGEHVGGFSYDEFGDNFWNLKSVDGKDIFNQGTKIDGVNTSANVKFNVSALNCKKVEWPDAGENYPDNKDANDKANNSDLPALTGDYDIYSPRHAWQGTFYVPASVSEDKRPSLVFHAESFSPDTPANRNQLTYNMPLLPDSVDGSKKITCGHYYDIVAKVTGVQTMQIANLKVAPWSTEQLKYSLQGPVYLHVDKTKVEVSAGNVSKMWYETNAETISFESPKYDGVDLYEIRTIPGTDSIRIEVNSRIDTKDFDNININIASYNFFHIKAGTLYKKIDVSPLILQRFLMVEPQVWTIDAREKIASGLYEETLKVTVKTNIKNFTIKDIDWTSAGSGDLLKIYSDEHCTKPITFSTSGTSCSPTDGQYVFYIKYKGLNSGDTFWKSSHSLNLEVSADNTGITPGPGYISPQNVTVNVVPANDNYIIHFKAEGWDWPHIYVYQCLEFPATWNKTFEYDRKSYNTQSMPIGYYYDKPTAALEYSFTGKIAFKGWDEPVNNASLSSFDTYGFKMIQGFFMFEDGNAEDCSWNASKSASDIRYFKNMDLCKDHRDRAIAQKNCDYCSSSPHALWPGIIMEKEPDGWWKFELSAVATPGKALIMFNNGHTEGSRYPGDSEVGIPLFDYPSREGWFDYNKTTKAFSPTKSGEGVATTRRIYFDNDNSWNPPHIYTWDNNNKTYTGNWPGAAMLKDSQGRWYYDISTSVKYVVFNNNSDSNGNKTGDITLTSANRYNTSGPNGNYGDNPTPSVEYYKYRFYWYTVSDEVTREYVYVWNLPTGTKMSDKTTDFTNNKNYHRTGTDGGFSYFEFYIPKNATFETANFILTSNNGWNDQTGDIYINMATFGYDSAKGYIYQFTEQPPAKNSSITK